MKLKKLIYFIPLVAILIAAGTSCNKAKFDINGNPNDPTDSTVTYDVVLPAALHASGTIIANQWGTIQNWMGYWARSGTYAPNVTEETYEITTAFGNGIWNACYDNNYDYNIVQLKAKAAGATFYEGIARIMKAHNFQILVDVYGNVPYSEALKGSANPVPKYDNGIDIYKALLREIDAGIDSIKNATVTATNGNKNIWKNDIMFGDPVNGKIDNVPAMKVKWAKFGNTLKLRLLIHAYNVAGIDKVTEMNKINTEGSGFLGAGENAQVQPGYVSDKPNPFYNTYKAVTSGAASQNQIYYAANEWGINWYEASQDPRHDRVYEDGAQGARGVKYGLPPITANARAELSGIGPGLYKTNTSPQCILSAAESFLLQAEARHRGFITTGLSAQTLLETGMLESMIYLGVTNAATKFSTFLGANSNSPEISYTAPSFAPSQGIPGGGLYTILAQKWFALNGVNTLEVWTDYRRVPYSEIAPTRVGAATDHFEYGEPSNYAPPGPPISVAPQYKPGTKIPVRYLYPQSEYNYNPTNVGLQGTITPTSKIFWDLN